MTSKTQQVVRSRPYRGARLKKLVPKDLTGGFVEAAEAPTYSDISQAEALVRLAINQGDIDKTSEQTGIAVKTLSKWAQTTPKDGVPELLDRALEILLRAVPTEGLRGKEWAIASGILLDKWLLVHGRSTSRVENVFKMFEKMSSDDLDSLITEFERSANASAARPSGEGETWGSDRS